MVEDASFPSSSSSSAVHAFVSHQKHLLELEIHSEVESKSSAENEHHRQERLTSLEVFDVSVGLYGRTVVSLTRRSSSSETPSSVLLPSHRFTVGDEVEILNNKQKSSSKRGVSGVLCKLTEESISVALFGSPPSKNKSSDEGDDDEDEGVFSPPLTLTPRSSMEVHRKMIGVLNEMERHGSDHAIAGSILEMVFDGPKVFPQFEPLKITPLNTRLNPSQLDAIEFCLDRSSPPLTFIHGPPGTGKTTTLAELIHQALSPPYDYGKILVCAPSNVAVDTILEHLTSSDPKLSVLRLGHPARIRPQTLRYSLEAVLSSHDSSQIITSVKTELRSHIRSLSTPKLSRDRRRFVRKEITLLRKEIRTRETKLLKEILNRTRVVLCTNVGAASNLLRGREFDLTIMDEAAQSLEAAAWIPLLKSSRAILAGDPFQLPPTVKSNAALKEGLGGTVMDRIFKMYPEDAVGRMLGVQYRMNRDIMGWSSDCFYKGRLSAAESVMNWKLGDLPGFPKEHELAEVVMLLLDTSGCGPQFQEQVTESGSRFNRGEAQLLVQHVENLIRGGVPPESIAVISPYNGQVDLLRNILLPEYPKLEIKSVDGFQGGEKEAVVLSLVRSNAKGIIGFLGEERRLNVAVTRAKKHLALICDVETVRRGGGEKLNGLMNWMEEKADWRSAMEFCAHEEVQDGIENNTLSKEIKVENHSKSPSVAPKVGKMPPHKKNSQTKEKGQERHKLLQNVMDRVKSFSEEGISGQELKVSDNLTKHERLIIHQLAENIDIHSRSEGVEGINRRVILSIPDQTTTKTRSTFMTGESEKEATTVAAGSVFSTFQDGDESDESDGKDGNNLLKSLAMERMKRQQQSQKQDQPHVPSSNLTGGKKPKKKNKPKKTKPNGRNTGQNAKKEPVEDLDDMSFLDAQIQKVQTSHGRTVEATGKKYQTIVNGVLLAKPKSSLPKKDKAASASLKQKLNLMETGRKLKSEGKKKKK